MNNITIIFTRNTSVKIIFKTFFQSMVMPFVNYMPVTKQNRSLSS